MFVTNASLVLIVALLKSPVNLALVPVPPKLNVVPLYVKLALELSADVPLP